MIGNPHLPRIILCGKLSEGHRHREALKKRFKDCLKKEFVACHIDYRRWSNLAENRDVWRLTTNQVSSSENTHRATKRQKAQE